MAGKHVVRCVRISLTRLHVAQIWTCPWTPGVLGAINPCAVNISFLSRYIAKCREGSCTKGTKSCSTEISPFGWHFHALLNSNAKFASVLRRGRTPIVTEQMYGLNEVRTNKIQRRFGENSIEARYANTKVPEGNRLFIKRKWRGQFENSRKVCRGVGKTS